MDFRTVFQRDVPPTGTGRAYLAEALWWERLAMFRATHNRSAISLGRHDWPLLTGGAGSQPLLLLHGSHSDAESLFALMVGLERTWRVYAPTYPDGVTSVVEIVEGLACMLDALRVASAVVVGYSLGGYVAQMLAHRHPNRIAALALLHSGGPSPSAARSAALQNALLAALPEAIVYAGASTGVAATLALEAPTLAAGEAAFWRRYLTKAARRTGKRRMLAHGQMVVDFHGALDDQPQAGERMRTPTLLIHGGRDHMIEPAERRALDQRFPFATRVLLPGAGHLSVVTQPQPYLAAIEANLRDARVDS